MTVIFVILILLTVSVILLCRAVLNMQEILEKCVADMLILRDNQELLQKEIKRVFHESKRK